MHPTRTPRRHATYTTQPHRPDPHAAAGIRPEAHDDAERFPIDIPPVWKVIREASAAKLLDWQAGLQRGLADPRTRDGEEDFESARADALRLLELIGAELARREQRAAKIAATGLGMAKPA